MRHLGAGGGGGVQTGWILGPGEGQTLQFPDPESRLSEWLGSHHGLCKCVGPAERGTRGDGVGSLKEKRKVPTSQVPTGQV